MGLELLDITFRLEKAFRMRLQRNDLFPFDVDPRTFTVGQVHDRLAVLMSAGGIPVPPDSWDRVRKCVGDALSIDPSRIDRSDRFVADLGVE